MIDFVCTSLLAVLHRCSPPLNLHQFNQRSTIDIKRWKNYLLAKARSFSTAAPPVTSGCGVQVLLRSVVKAALLQLSLPTSRGSGLGVPYFFFVLEAFLFFFFFFHLQNLSLHYLFCGLIFFFSHVALVAGTPWFQTKRPQPVAVPRYEYHRHHLPARRPRPRPTPHSTPEEAACR